MIGVRDEGAVRVVTFDRPAKRNAFDQAMYHGVAEALEQARHDDAVTVVALTGAGPSFCAGQDLAEMAAIATGAPGVQSDGFPHLLDALCAFDKPLLAAVRGWAVGVGCTMLAYCDMVLVAPDARLRAPFAELGVPPEAASSLLLPLRMGWQRAAGFLLTGDALSAEEAVAAGLARRVCPADALLEETMTLARRIACHPLEALRATKSLMMAALAPAIAEARAREDAAFARLLAAAADRPALRARLDAAVGGAS